MEKEFKLLVHSRWFDVIKSGEKKWEGRRFHGKVRELRLLDCVNFVNYEDAKVESVRKQIVGLLWFPNFETALIKLGLENVLPGVKTIGEGVDTYLKFVSAETQKKEGVLMIQF